MERSRPRRARRVRRATSSGPTGSSAARDLARVPARPALERRTAGCTAPGARATAGGTGYLDDYADVANGLLELHAATGEAPLARGGPPARRCSRSSSSPTRRTAASSRPRSTASGSSCGSKILDDHPAPSGNSMLAYVLLRLARIYGDDRLEQRAGVAVFAADRRAGSPQAPAAFGFGLVAADFILAPRREIAIVGPAPTRPSRAPCCARFDPHAVIAFGPSETVPLLRGEDARRRPAGGVRLRALHLPGAGDRTCCARRSAARLPVLKRASASRRPVRAGRPGQPGHYDRRGGAARPPTGGADGEGARAARAPARLRS